MSSFLRLCKVSWPCMHACPAKRSTDANNPTRKLGCAEHSFDTMRTPCFSLAPTTKLMGQCGLPMRSSRPGWQAANNKQCAQVLRPIATTPPVVRPRPRSAGAVCCMLHWTAGPGPPRHTTGRRQLVSAVMDACMDEPPNKSLTPPRACRRRHCLGKVLVGDAHLKRKNEILRLSVPLPTRSVA